MSDDLLYKLIEILAPILMAALTYAAARLSLYIQAKTKNEWLKGALVRLDDAVVTVVREIQQTVVDAIKAANADGKITPAEITEIKEAALKAVKTHLGTKGLLELAKILGLSDGALDGLITSKIEAAVHDLKAADPTKPRP